MIYLDSNATTQVRPEVLEAMMPYLTSDYFNPSSGYRAGKRVKAAVENARGQVASLINAAPEEIVFTGCGTESNNMALKWLSRVIGRKGSRVVTSQIEHSAVLRPCETFAGVGFDVERIRVDQEGRIDLDEFRASCLEKDKTFASVMWANNETGVLQPLDEIAHFTAERGIPLHTDAIQAVGKVPVDVKSVPVDFLSISGHKFHAPKGVGALFCRSGKRFEPMLRGGGQEQGRRSGTENVAFIVGLGKAAELAQQELGHQSTEVKSLRDQLEEGIMSRVSGVTQNGNRKFRTPNVTHLSFENCDAGSLLILLDERGILCSAGSACMTGKSQPSHVQLAMGISPEQAKTSLRLSLSVLTTKEEIQDAIGVIEQAVAKVRQVQSPGVGPVVVYN